MSLQAGVGRSLERDSRSAGLAAARGAREAMGDGPVQAALVFGTAPHDQEALVAAVRESFPDAEIAGCSGEGVIGGEHSDETEWAVSVLAVREGPVRFRSFLVPGHSEDSSACALELVKRLRESGLDDARALLVFPDGLGGDCDLLLSTLDRELPDDISITGGSAGDAMAMEKTYQYGTTAVVSGGLSAVRCLGNNQVP